MYVRLVRVWDRRQGVFFKIYMVGTGFLACVFISLAGLTYGAIIYLFTTYIVTNFLFDMST